MILNGRIARYLFLMGYAAGASGFARANYTDQVEEFIATLKKASTEAKEDLDLESDRQITALFKRTLDGG
jgi:hypothetical protein